MPYTPEQLTAIIHDSVLQVVRKEGISGATAAIKPSEWAVDHVVKVEQAINALQSQVTELKAGHDEMRRVIYEEVVKVIRQAVGPDDAKTRAGAYFERIEQKLDELLGQ